MKRLAALLSPSVLAAGIVLAVSVGVVLAAPNEHPASPVASSDDLREVAKALNALAQSLDPNKQPQTTLRSAVWIPAVSALVALGALWLAWVTGNRTFRRSVRSDLTKMLGDTERLLVEKPHLWAVWSTHQNGSTLAKSLAQGNPPVTELEQKCQREAFIYLHLNLFDLAFDHYHAFGRLGGTDRSHWVSWDGFIRDFLENQEVKDICTSPMFTKEYDEPFRKYIDSIVQGKCAPSPSLWSVIKRMFMST